MLKMTSPLVALWLLIISIFVFETTDIDIHVQEWFYNHNSGQWLISNQDKVLKFIFYDGIKKLVIAFVVLSFIITVCYRHTGFVKQHKAGLQIFFLSAVLVPATIGLLKAITNVPCPVNLSHFGGNFPYVTLFSSYPDSFIQTGQIQCYPAGHASGGFALMSLYYFFNTRRYKNITLFITAFIGWSMGLYKMLIGDHFLSHTIVSFLIAWLIISSLANVINRHQR